MFPRHGFLFVLCATSEGALSCVLLFCFLVVGFFFNNNKKKIYAFLKEVMNNSILRKEAQEQLIQSFLFTVLFMLEFLFIGGKLLFV